MYIILFLVKKETKKFHEKRKKLLKIFFPKHSLIKNKFRDTRKVWHNMHQLSHVPRDAQEMRKFSLTDDRV